MGMPSINNRPSLYNMPISPSVPAPTLSTNTLSSQIGNCSHQTACSCPQQPGQNTGRPQVAAAPPTVYILPIFMNSATAPPNSAGPSTTLSSEAKPTEKKTTASIKEKAATAETTDTSSKTEDSKTNEETKSEETKSEESKKGDTKKTESTKTDSKTETKTDGKPLSEEERVGKQVGEFITKLLTKYPELMDKLKDFLEDPGPTVNRIHRAFHRSRILRLFMKIPDRILLWPFDEETRPVMRKILKFLKSTPKWDDFDFDFDKEFPDFALN